MIIEPYTWHRVRITGISAASSDTISVTFERPTSYKFRAGQYTIVRLLGSDKRTIMRQYSFSSAPDADDLECTIQKEPEGEASTWFFEQCKPGDTIEISQAFGKFVWDPHTTRPLVFIAGRVGIAPFMSMIRDHRGHKQMISVLYSVNAADQVCFESELSAVNAHIFTTSSGERISRDTLVPYVANQPLIYLCGSRQFVEAMQQHVHTLGVKPADIRRELFTL